MRSLLLPPQIAYEAPPGVKKNLQRTYDSWTPAFIGGGGVLRAQLLFLLAWFHAVVQERRGYVPQVTAWACCCRGGQWALPAISSGQRLLLGWAAPVRAHDPMPANATAMLLLQGWSKYYEFSTADLRSGCDVVALAARDAGAGGQPKWAALHGLLELAIYGGRVDDVHDAKVCRRAEMQQPFASTFAGCIPLLVAGIGCAATKSADVTFRQ
jgi:dynein heavy chain 2